MFSSACITSISIWMDHGRCKTSDNGDVSCLSQEVSNALVVIDAFWPLCHIINKA